MKVEDLRPLGVFTAFRYLGFSRVGGAARGEEWWKRGSAIITICTTSGKAACRAGESFHFWLYQEKQVHFMQLAKSVLEVVLIGIKQL